ncbi:MAG TPA: anthranilate synthase component I family protein [Pyrinomonadaceae bacterium]|nr:anthranilate synthase component I family protein [Pyrinomonadaceae bacterium]
MRNLQPKTFVEFELEAKRGNVVPVVRTVPGDLQTPVGAFLAVAGNAKYSFLLESVEGGERAARYSFLGAAPEMIVRGRGNKTFIERGEAVEVVDIRAPDFLKEHFRTRRLAKRSGLPPLAGGVVGYLAYSAARWFEPKLETGIVGEGIDELPNDAVWMFYKSVLAFDSVHRRIEITSIVFIDEADSNRERLRGLYDDAVAETRRLEKVLTQSSIQPAQPAMRTNTTASFVSGWPREEFEQAVNAAKESIAAGDCYQVVLSQRFKRNVAAAPVNIYRALRSTNPSPYMFMMRLDNEWVIGASPETLVRCQGPRLDYRPIAGTRARGKDEAEDLLLGSELRADEKEVAEHVMLVDLGRNDLGRVAAYGSVKVEKLMTVERYSHVQHLVTELSAELREPLDRFDALASCFPAGTVTGAPKLRAMEIIHELEPEPRGVYAGAVFYADYADNLDSCIAIRTIVIGEDGKASVQAGAGIVADSIPSHEYEETVNKARALFRAVEIAEGAM